MPIRRIEFEVAGDTIVADLHLPTGERPFPAVVTGGPMTSVKEQVTGTYAAALADRGFAALTIDHRHYGESGGQPRQYEFYPHKIEDLNASIDALAEQPEVDERRLGAVGICLGSGYLAHAIKARSDVRGFVAIAGYYRDVPAMMAADPQGFQDRIDQGRKAREVYEATGDAAMIPAVSLEEDAAMTLQSTYDYYAVRAKNPNYTNAFAVMSREHFLQFDVQNAAPDLRLPFLQLHGPNALNPAWADKFFRAVRGEKHQASLVSKGQTDIYDDPAIVADASDQAADFLWKVLGS